VAGADQVEVLDGVLDRADGRGALPDPLAGLVGVVELRAVDEHPGGVVPHRRPGDSRTAQQAGRDLLRDRVVPGQLRDNPHSHGWGDVLGHRRPLQQIGGDLGGDLVIPGQIGDGLDLLVHRDRPVDALADDPLRAVGGPLPRAGARVERRVFDRRPPLVLIHHRGQDAVDSERHPLFAVSLRPPVGCVAPVLHCPPLDTYVVREHLQRLRHRE
jgi:hypothetical protein